MAKDKPKCCATCAFAKFDRTPKGNIVRSHAGRCEYEIKDWPKLPYALLRAAFFRLPDEDSYSRIGPKDGADCQVYERANDGKETIRPG